MSEDQLADQLSVAQEQMKQLQHHIPSEEEFSDVTPDEQLTQQIAQQVLTVRYLTVSDPLLSSMLLLLQHSLIRML